MTGAPQVVDAAGALRRRVAVGWSAAALAGLGVVLAYHAAVFSYGWSDENVHLYVAARVADGAALYGEVHSARPPLSLAPLVGLLALGVPPLFAARTCVVLATLATVALLVWAGRRFWSGTAALAAAVLFVLGPGLAGRHSFTGMDLVALWTAATVVVAIRRRAGTAGALAGVALMTGQHAGVVVLGVGAWFGVQGWRPALRYALAAAAVVGGGVAVVMAAGGHDVFADLVGRHTYHLGEAPDEGQFGWWLPTWVLENAALLLLAGGAAVVVAARRAGGAEEGDGWGHAAADPAHVVLGLAALHVVVVALMPGALILYLQPAAPLLCLAGGATVDCWIRMLREDVVPAARRRRVAAMTLLALGGLAVAGWAGATARFERRDGLAYPILPLLRHVRMAAIQEPVVLREIRTLLAGEDAPAGTVFGHATLVSLVALDTGRRVSAELADLAPRWFQTGGATQRDVIERIERDNVAWFVTPNWFYPHDREFRAYLGQCYERPTILERVEGNGIPRVLVFRHRADRRPCVRVERADSRSPRTAARDDRSAAGALSP